MLVPSLAELYDRRTKKWTTYPEEVLPAWIAESDFGTCPKVKAAIEERVNAESFGYPPAHSGLAEATANFYADRYGWVVSPDHVVVVPDVIRGMTLAVQHFTRPDSAVIVPGPAYPPFFGIPEITGRSRVDLDAREGIDLDAVEVAFAAGAGSILLCSPHNPLGRTYDPQFLRDLTDLAARYKARVIVDEIHAPLVYDDSHVCVAGVSGMAASACITVTATSKAWNIAGLKCAQILFSNEADLETWEGLNPILKEGASTLGIYGAEACYRHGVDFLEEEIEFLRGNRDYLVEELPKVIPRLKVNRPQATYLMWLDFRETAVAADPAGMLLRDGLVALNAGKDFGPLGAGHARLNFATSRSILDEIMERMGKAYKANA